MKLLVVLTVVAASLAGVSAQAFFPNRITTNVYPCPHSGATRLAHSWSCSKFVQCVNGFAAEKNCVRGLVFSEEHQQCMQPNEANCVVEDSPCPRWTDPEDIFYLTSAEGSNYFMCLDGAPLSMQCASGYIFNRRELQCDPEAVNLVSSGSDF